jgi:hypothetical protein
MKANNVMVGSLKIPFSLGLQRGADYSLAKRNYLEQRGEEMLLITEEKQVFHWLIDTTFSWYSLVCSVSAFSLVGTEEYPVSSGIQRSAILEELQYVKELTRDPRQALCKIYLRSFYAEEWYD